MKKTYLEQMGLLPVQKLDKKTCNDRVKVIRKGIDSGRFKGRLLQQAKYYVKWYKWMADNGGTRGKKTRTRKSA